MGLDFNIINESEKFALAHTKTLTGLNGRWDVISEYPTIVLDVAHNTDGIKQVLDQIQHLHLSTEHLHFVIGMVNDKDISSVLSLLPKKANYYFTNAHIPRALPHNILKEKAASFGLMGESFEDVNDAIKAAKQKVGGSGIIIVCGSVFVVGEVDTALF